MNVMAAGSGFAQQIRDNGFRAEDMMKGKVLIVDDDASVRGLFHDVLTDDGYEVRAVEDGPQALTILEEETIQVIFLDLKLFGMNGIELCRRIRKTSPLSIIYAVTGWAALFEIEECREAGFDDYFVKPLSVDRIARAVDDAFEKIGRWNVRTATLV